MKVATPTNSLHVLLVEDNPTDVLLLQVALEQVQGLKVAMTHVKRLDEALLRLQSDKFDAVLLDLGLPDSSGLDTFTQAQSRNANIPILVLSGLDDETLALTAVRDGAQDYLVKGKLDSTMLARTIRYAIERKFTAQKLMASEMGYRRLFETAQDGIFILDSDTGQITDANPFLEKLLGYSTAEFIGKRLWEISPFRMQAANELAFRTLRENGFIQYDDLPLATKDGRLIDVEFFSNVYSIGGKSLIQCNIRDITERKRGEMALQEAQQFLQATLDGLLSQIAVLDEAGNIIAVNKVWAQFADQNGGTAVSCAAGANYLQVCDAASGEWAAEAPQVAEGIRQVVAGTRQMFGLEYPCHSPSEKGWFELRVTRYSGKGPVRVVIAHNNITARKLAEEQIRFQAHLIEKVGQAVIATDINGSITFWNSFAEALYGWTASEVLGRSILDVTPAQDSQPLSAQIMSQVGAGESWSGEFTMKRRDGSTFIAQVDNTSIYDSAGIRVGVIGISTDITERQRIARELQNSKEQFESIVTNVPGMVYQFQTQPDGSIHWPFVGDGFEELFEADPELLLQTPAWPMDQVHPDDRDDFDRSVATSSKMLLPRSWEGRLRLGSGTVKWIQIESRPQRLPGGGTLWNGLILDITSRKVAEGERDRFFTMSLDLLCIADHNGYFKRLNPAFAATLGYSDSELMAKPFLEWVHPDDREATLAVMQRLDAGQPAIEFVNRYLCRDGSYRWLSWVSAPYENLIYAAAHDVTSLKIAEADLQQANDQLELRVAERTTQLSRSNEQLLLEISERQAAEATLYKNHELLAVVLENTAEGIVACDAEGQLTFFNRATREFHGLPLEPISPTRWPDYYSLYSPDGVTPLQTGEVPLLQALNGTPIHDIEMVIAPQQGTRRTVTNNGGPLFGPTGEKLGAVVVMHDITQRKQAEVELQRAKQEADDANQAKSEFLSRMSHELRTPLNAVLGFGQILEMSSRLNDKDIDAVGHILKGGRHLLGLINEVLDIASIEAGRISISPEPIRYSETVREVLDMVRPLANVRHIQINNRVDESDTRQVQADHQRFRQVLLNLLANAIKYNCDGGRVEIACELRGEVLRFNVSDSGSGLTNDDLAKLFVPFERLGAAQLQVEGTGLGLVLCKKLVEVMDGRIGVDSEPGRGSTFWVELPLAASPPLHLQTESARGTTPLADCADLPECGPRGRQQSVLYIEDNPSNFKVIERLLEDRPQVKILSAMQGSIGLDLARQHLPDLILLDLHLPDIPGDVVLHRLRADSATCDIPVVVLSADATAAQIEKLRSAGIKYYLTKPIDLQQFQSVLDDVLNPKNT